MRFDPTTTIAGLRLGEVKKIVKESLPLGFSLPWIAKRRKLPEADAKAVLDAIVEAGYLKLAPRERHEAHGVFVGPSDSDCWVITELGQALTATKLIPRTPIDKARALLPKIIAEAESLNADPYQTHRITRIYLFGSVLNGSTDGTVGDVDIAFSLERRPLPDAELKEIEEAMAQECPLSDFMGQIMWPQLMAPWCIRKINRIISTHPVSDLIGIQAKHELIYAFDVENDRPAPAGSVPLTMFDPPTVN